ncbi:prolyl 4-hydroxylase subunit alpha-1-like [Pollicipes pollicipes]|uniref:prolyl 4-hydroxylase subunit alpha-1-like n=1 Tax=Pollicipes pollicipes TaxID=41117 RepID=UPI001885921C|nr:prolyl 4-hydroxylase subunit alpha-1-like [Pollicipes pollicipes]
MFQIVNYGIGGHYNYHDDFLYKDATRHQFEHTPDYLNSGDRIATFMFYLSDVIRGGATAFPKLGVSVFPERGAAAFWYNLRRNGRGDVRALHGGCPVAYGAKWIANKWVRERNQFLRRPCTLDPSQ